MYDKVKIIFEKDGEEIVRGEVLARENPDDTADYVTQNFWTMHKATEQDREAKDEFRYNSQQ